MNDKIIWKNGQREESGWKQVKFGEPFARATQNLRKAAENREDFDPTVLFQWGAMMSMALLTVLKDIEEKYGPEGQETVRKALNKVGYDVAKQLYDGAHFPEDASDIEKLSYFITGVNTICYASLEEPRILDKESCDFDIHWCPYEDLYTAFDCRIQRYVVEGMIQFIHELGWGPFHIEIDQIKQKRNPTCHFVMKLRKPEEEDAWRQYSSRLGERAFEKSRNQPH